MQLVKFKKPETVYWIVLVLFFLVNVVVLANFNSAGSEQWDWRSHVVHHAGPKIYRTLDGQLVAADKTNLRPVAVILENHADSRPVSGLENASIIYEIIVEGDITRFLAIFDYNINSKKIGPVRSARPFFVELAEEWDAVLFHAGGSQDAMYKLTYSSIYHVNEISGDGIYFWRDTLREPPHNLYISATQIERAVEAKGVATTTTGFLPWQFKDKTLVKSAGDQTRSDIVKVNFSGNPLYQVEYHYNSDVGDYTRYLNGKLHKTDRGIILKTENVVVQHVNFKILDDYGRLYIDLQSGGLAEIYQAGKKIEGSWRWQNKRTKYYDSDGEEIKFNRGRVWVELVFD